LYIGVTFFGINLYFTSVNHEKERVWKEHQVIKKERIEKERLENINKRTLAPSELPLVEIYQDNGGSEFLSVGVLTNGSILTIGWVEAMPEEVFVRPFDSTDSLDPYLLNKPEETSEDITIKDAPVVYSKNGTDPVKMFDMPLLGQFDLQLVTMYPKDPFNPLQIGLGELRDGNFLSLRTDISAPPPSAIALYKTPKGFLPVGLVLGFSENLVDLEDFDSLRNTLVKVETPPKDFDNKTETFYVLENSFQQLVFSNFGGALAEINLPFQESMSEVSVVRPIEVDRLMVELDPKNALFPSHPYFTAGDSLTDSYVKHNQGHESGYYPLIRRSFTGIGSEKTLEINPKFYAFNTLSEYPEVAQLVYQVKEFSKSHIIFEADQRQRKITKTYRLAETQEASPYCFDLEVKIDGDSRGLWLSTGVPEAEWVAGSFSPNLKYRYTKAGKGIVEAVDLPSDATTITSSNPDWICNSNGFFGIILDPLTEAGSGWRAQKVPGGTVPSRLIALENEHPDWNAQDLPGYLMMLPLKVGGGVTSFRVFSGPFSTRILNQVDAIYTDPVTNVGPDYISCQTFHGWFAFISEPFAKFLFLIMDFFHMLTGSWALSIVLLTVVLRIILYPLTAWSTRSMLGMQRVQPKIQALQEKYKNDKQKLQMEIFALYKKEKVNPLTGCLPMLIQMPFLIGMFDLLKSTFALRGASFIPGWIDNLAAPDVLFTWDFHIPFIGSEFHLLPILLGLVMFLQTKVGSSIPKDPEKMTDQQRQQKATSSIMAIFFMVLFYKFPSGLNIYWLSSMLLSMLQQWFQGRRMKMEKAKA
ncbi:membrane protein insertase YidC, partial [Chlamydiales bacterium]|nr:membrane protein insertase YidC [Chlamydiales bacterium]